MLPDDSLCNDNSAATYVDVCTAGICAGLLPCTGTCVALQNRVGVAETLDYGVRRIQPGEGWDAGAFGVRDITLNNSWAGVRFNLPSANRSVVVGLSNTDGSSGYVDIAYGLLVTRRARRVRGRSVPRQRGHLRDW